MAGRTARIVLFLVLLVLPALMALMVFGYTAAKDIGRLAQARQGFTGLVTSDGSPTRVYSASAFEDIHRVNAFADGTWALLCAVMLGIGAHGLLGWRGGRHGPPAAVLARAVGFCLLLIVPGIIGMGLFGRLALTEYHELIGAYDRLEALTRTADPTLESVIVANAIQHGHRLNVFAAGTWALLSAIVACLGLHGLLSLQPPEATVDDV